MANFSFKLNGKSLAWTVNAKYPPYISVKFHPVYGKNGGGFIGYAFCTRNGWEGNDGVVS